MKLLGSWIGIFACAALVSGAAAEPAATGSTPAAATGYETGFKNVTNLHADLCQALDRKQRSQVAGGTVFLGETQSPCLSSAPALGKGSPGGPAQLSAGFVEFVNHMAHAKAIDENDHGFYRRFSAQIAAQSQNNKAPDFDALLSGGSRDFQTMNRQASHFNQMAGGLVAVELAHQYLGHYTRHAAEFSSPGASPTPVNSLITEQEWHEAVMRGANNALACGLSVEGLRNVFDCFEKMSTRPPWAAYFIHSKANVSKINAELKRLERDFFVIGMEQQKGASDRSFGSLTK